MIVSLGRRRAGRGIGDAVDAALAGDDGAAVASANTGTDVWSVLAGSTAAAPPPPAQSSSSSSWSSILQPLVAGLVQGVTSPFAPKRPPAPVSSGLSTGVIVAGVAGVALVGFLLLRRREA